MYVGRVKSGAVALVSAVEAKGMHVRVCIKETQSTVAV
jgi:hypothetical protein